MDLKNKVIVVTGSTRVIGRATAKACARRDAKVVICSRSKSAVENICKEFLIMLQILLGR
jgi:NAD(P)-dependent dehydrogenase (short-subunit alcohol dehydrogenase family)